MSLPAQINPGTFSQENMEIIKNISAPNATDAEFKHFIYLCYTYGLDPLKKEIYFIKYSNKAPVIVTSRDGYLKIANQSDLFDGMETEVIYEGDVVTKRDNGSLHIAYGPAHLAFDGDKIMGAFCNVFRKDRAIATSVMASIHDYFKKDSNIWNQYPNAMIMKVAESMALKRAFSISGLVSQEEMGEEK